VGAASVVVRLSKVKRERVRWRMGNLKEAMLMLVIILTLFNYLQICKCLLGFALPVFLFHLMCLLLVYDADNVDGGDWSEAGRLDYSLCVR
jgi:hypothetical protein